LQAFFSSYLTIGREYGKEMALENAEKRQKRCVFCSFLLKGSVFSYVFIAFSLVFQGEISGFF
jgi:hypothetical protein